MNSIFSIWKCLFELDVRAVLVAALYTMNVRGLDCRVLLSWLVVWSGTEAFVGTITIGRTERGSITRRESGVYTLLVPDYRGDQPAIRLTVTSSNATPRTPILVSVQQENAVTSFRIPYVENGTQFQYASRTLCPFSNRPANTSRGLQAVQITLSTSSADSLNFTLLAVIIEEFQLELNSTLQVVVNPATPALFFFTFSEDVPVNQVRMLLEATEEVCTIIHVQDVSPGETGCPNEVTTGSFNFHGEYQTMLTQGVVIKQRKEQVPSFFVSIIVTVSNLCEQQSSDLLAAFGRSVNLSTPIMSITYDFHSNSSNITLSVHPGLSATDYAAPIAGMAGVFFLFYILALILILSGSPKALFLAIKGGMLCSRNDSLKYKDGSEEEKTALNGPSREQVDSKLKTFGVVEEVDGFFEKKPPVQEPESFEMQEFTKPRDVEASIEVPPESSIQHRSFSLLPKSWAEQKSLSMGRRPRNAVTESEAPARPVPQPSLADILSGRYNEVKKRSNSISRRETTSSMGSTRSGSISLNERRQTFSRAKTFTEAGAPRKPTLHQTHSMAPADRTRPLKYRRPNSPSESSGVFSGTPQSPDVTKSLPIELVGAGPGYRDPGPQRPASPHLLCSISPLDSIAEVNTLPRPPKDRVKDASSLSGSSPGEEQQAGVGQGNSPTTSPAVLQGVSQETQVTASPSPGGSPSQPLHIAGEGVQPGSQKSVTHPLTLSIRQHSYSESQAEATARSSPVLGRARTSSLSQEKDRLPPPFQRTSSKEERSSARLRRQPSRLEEEAVTPLLRGDEERGLGEEDELSSSAEKEPTESPTPVPIPTSSNQIADPQQPISPSQTTHSSLSPVLIGEGRSSSTQPMLGGGGEEVYEQEELEVKGSFEENEYKIPETLADLDFPEGKAAQSQSNRFLWQLIGLSLFYMLPAYQLVIAYLKFLEISGNQDLCYFNDRCSWPVDLLRSFNSIWSNIGYVILGFLLFIVVLRAKNNYREHEKEVNEAEDIPKGRKEGVPQYFGVYFALAFVLVAQGFLSAAYHICPNQATFQFDTTFMYIMAGLTILRVFQSRHPDSVPSASFAFIVFSLIIIIAVVGTLHANIIFYSLWFAVYMIAVWVLAFLFYFKGRITNWKMCVATFKRPCPPGNVPKCVFVILFILLNIVIGAAGLAYEGDFGSHLLVVFISNFAFYMLYHITVNWIKHGRPAFLMVFYFVIAFAFWIPAIVFFVIPESNWVLSPSKSREQNRDCSFWGFYDYHDLWHFLSAFALFFSMLAIMNLDKKQRHNPREEIYLF